MSDLGIKISKDKQVKSALSIRLRLSSIFKLELQ